MKPKSWEISGFQIPGFVGLLADTLIVIWGTHFSKSFTFKPSDRDHKVGDYFVTMTRIAVFADFYSAQPK